MAGNSSTFYLRQTANEANIKQWQAWSVDINYVVSQFNDVVQNLTDKIELANTTINALNTKIDRLGKALDKKIDEVNERITDHEKIINSIDLRYVVLQYDNVEICSSKNAMYAKSCGVFSSIYGEPNMVNVFAPKTIDGLYVNDSKVYNKSVGEYCQPFASFAGSTSGTIVTLKSKDIAKLGDDIELYFSIDSSIKNASMFNFDPTNNDIAKLVVKVNYSTVVAKPIITFDKSKLSKTLTNTTVMSTDAMPVSKYAAQFGQYSTLKTVAQTAKNNVINLNRDVRNGTSIRTGTTRTTRKNN